MSSNNSICMLNYQKENSAVQYDFSTKWGYLTELLFGVNAQD